MKNVHMIDDISVDLFALFNAAIWHLNLKTKGKKVHMILQKSINCFSWFLILPKLCIVRY